MKRWIIEEFEKKRLQVKAELATARSRIHMSFDGWTSLNGLAIVGVVVHYLDKDLINRSYLIGVRRINGAHAGENIAEAVMPIFVNARRIRQDHPGHRIPNDAASKGHLDIVLELQRRGADVKAAVKDGSTPLHCAAAATPAFEPS